MKVIIVLLAVIALVVGGIYMFGGYKDFNPDEQGRTAKAAIKPGMTVSQVVAVAGSKPKLQVINVTRPKPGKKGLAQRVVGPPVPFDEAKVNAKVSTGGYKDGFVLSYAFSEQVAFNVDFNGAGLVTDISDAATMADLLGTRKRDE